MKTIICQQCGKEFTGYSTRQFCDDCRRERKLKYQRKWDAAHQEYNRERNRCYYAEHRLEILEWQRKVRAARRTS